MSQGQQSVQEMIEAHLEKGVLGLCVVALLYAVFHWVLISPQSVDLFDGKTEVAARPSQADEILRNAADTINNQAKMEKIPPLTMANHVARLEWVQETPFVSDTSVFAGLMMPPELRQVAVIEGPGVRPTLAGLVMRIPEATPAPQAWAGWTWYQVDDVMNETIMATAVAPYPFMELHGLWDVPLKNASTDVRVVVSGVDVEAEARTPGGQWYSVPAAPEASRPEGWAPLAAAPVFDGSNADDVRAWIETAQKGYHAALTKPQFHLIYNPGSAQWVSWRERLPKDMIADQEDELWFHVPGLQVGREYRYRYRLSLVNPLFGSPEDLAAEDAPDAAQALVTTPWSDWSVPVLVEDLTRLYVPGANRNENQIKIAVVAQKYGQEVSAEFNVSPGQVIGGSRMMDVTNPMTSETTREEVSFDTGCVVVSLDFVKQTYRSGVPKETVELFYLSPDGQLHSRIQWVDQERYRAEQE